MTRRDYIAFAAVIKGEREAWHEGGPAVLAIEETAMRIANLFEQDNPRFDRQRFYAACGMRFEVA